MTNVSDVISVNASDAVSLAQQHRIDAMVASFSPEQFAFVASQFCADVHSYVGDEAFAEIAARNASRQPEDMGICHTHDFCDANVFMSSAFKTGLVRAGLQFEPAYEVMVDPEPWNQAWTAAQKLIPQILATQPIPPSAFPKP